MSQGNPQSYQVGQTVTARIEEPFPFGVFVRLADGTQAYVRKRELTLEGTLDPRDVVEVGQEISAKVIQRAAPDRKLELSVRQVAPDPWQDFSRRHSARDTVVATVKNLSAGGVFVQVVPGVDGFVPAGELAPWTQERTGDLLWAGDRVEAMITRINPETQWLRLSIKQQLDHNARVQRITGRLRVEDAPEPETDEPEEERSEEETPPAELTGLGLVLVLEDHDEVRRELVEWLQRHGCQASGVSTPEQGLEHVARVPTTLALVDLDLAGEDGLDFVRAITAHSPGTRIIAMSTPNWIAEKSLDLEALQVTEVFTKPLDLDEVRDTLSRLARGEAVGPYRVTQPEPAEESANAFQHLADTMRSGAPLETRLQAALQDLVQRTHAGLCVLFHLDPRSQQVRIAARAGHLPVDESAVYALAASPVKDLIIERRSEFEAGLSEQTRRRYQNLLRVVPFESCAGVQVQAAGNVEHALFLFHRERNGLSQDHLRDAYATAGLLGLALESQALEARIDAISPFLLSGQLAAAFGHDVFNKMSALELMVRNLNAVYEAAALQRTVQPQEGPGSGDDDPLSDRLQGLLQHTLDLKRTAEAFRQLVRADKLQEMDINQVVQRSTLLLDTMARRANVQITYDLAPELPEVAGNPARLEQVFMNLVLNAIQHTGEKIKRWPAGWGQIEISTGVEPGAERRVWVRVADTGPGIHHRLWDPIFALGFSTRPGGTGLGLFIARSLLTAMGGVIRVEQSLVPSGTTFRIDLPAVRPRATEESRP